MLRTQLSWRLLALTAVTGAGLMGPIAHAQEGTADEPEARAEADEQPAGGEQQLEETVVTGEALDEEDYTVDEASTATRTSTPILETPASVQVVPRQVIEDQAAQGLEDIYTNIPNVTEAGNTLNAQSEVLPIIRGFESQILLRNGMRSTSTGSVDPVNIESLEVLKGPSSILYGQIEPGGVLNITTKRPQADPFFDLNQQFGSYSHSRTTFDATGPLNEGETLLYRFNGAYTDSGSFRNDVDLRRLSLNPSLTFRPTDATEITFDFSYTEEEVPYDTGVPFSDAGRPLVSPDTFFGDPSLGGRELEDYYASYQLRHELNETWTLRNQFQFHRVDNRNEGLRNRGVGGSPGAETLTRRYQNQESWENEYQLVTDLVGEFSTGEVDHEALIGVDLYYGEFANDRFRQNAPAIAISDNPNTSFTPPANNEPQRAWSGLNRRAALYVQDQMKLLPDDRLHLLVGGRYDYVETHFDRAGSPNTVDYDDAFTGRAGALYELTDWAAPYASVSQSFQPQFAGTATSAGDPIDPEEGLQYEAGFKFDFFDERLVTTVSAFQIEKENVAVFDSDYFTNTGNIAYLPGVEQRSRGFEVYTVGQVTEELSVIGGYGYTDTETTANPVDPDEIGKRFGGVPLHTGRVWVAYDFAENTSLAGLGFGGGVRFQSEQSAQFDDTTLSGFGVVDAGLWYRRQLESGQRLNLQLNVLNLFDKEYYTRASDQSIVHPGDPTTLYASVGIEF